MNYKKHNLGKSIEEESFSLIAIHASIEDFQLAYFINKKWDDIDIWWNDLKRKKVISEFLNIFQKEKDYLHPWKNYLHKIK